ENLFPPSRPATGWETRVIDNMRAARWWAQRPWSKWTRVAASVAAPIVLGTLGAILHGFVSHGDFSFPGTAFMALGKVRMAQGAADDRAVEYAGAVSTNHLRSLGGKMK